MQGMTYNGITNR